MGGDYTVASQVTLYISHNTKICNKKIENFRTFEIGFELHIEENCHLTTKHYIIAVSSIAGLLSEETEDSVAPANLKLWFGRVWWFLIR